MMEMMKTKIFFYKRKIEWKVSLYSSIKTYDNINAGVFDEYNTKGMKIELLSSREFNTAAILFSKFQNRYLEIVDVARKLSSEIWSFNIECLFEWKRKGINSQCFAHYYVQVFFVERSVDFISVQSAEDLKQKIIRIKRIYFPFKNIFRQEYFADNMRFSVIFHNSAASVFAHEVLGHVLEVDNYFRYDYASIVELFRNLQVDIIDDPLIPGAPGFYEEDDMGIMARRTVVYENGDINALIGSNSSEAVIANSLRRENYDKPCYPRMSNLLIKASSVAHKRDVYQFIRIDKLSKCFIYHTKKVVEFNVDFAVLHTKNIDIPLMPFKLEYDIVDLLSRLCVISGGDMELRPIQCAKHNQVISCGALSPDWMIINE